MAEYHEALFVVTGTGAPVILLAHLVATSQILDALALPLRAWMRPSRPADRTRARRALVTALLAYLASGAGGTACITCLAGSTTALANKNDSAGIHMMPTLLIISMFALLLQVCASAVSGTLRRNLRVRPGPR